MPNAYSILPDRFGDLRHEAIETGLKANGYEIIRGAGSGVPNGPDDVLVTWTVHRGYKENAALKFEAAGGRVIVCEEAYIRRIRGVKCFALALHDHNGAGRWPGWVGTVPAGRTTGGYYAPDRWDSFSFHMYPWRQESVSRNQHIIVREQRGIGSAKMASPPNWHENMAKRLRTITDRPIVIRWHPKSRIETQKTKDQPQLDQALQDCWAVVTWASSIAVDALLHGVPVFVDAPHHVLDGALQRDVASIDTPLYPERRAAFHRLAWAQWSMEEIKSGFAFQHLLGIR